jgi:hypothetical protein
VQNDPITTLRRIAWERAKGELRATAATFTDPRSDRERAEGQSFKTAAEGLIATGDKAIAGNGLAEGHK